MPVDGIGVDAEIDMPSTLEQLLASFDPVRHGGEAMAVTTKVGAETM
jgi:hypothetical protein